MRNKWTNAGPCAAVAEAAHTVTIVTTVVPSTCPEPIFVLWGKGSDLFQKLAVRPLPQVGLRFRGSADKNTTSTGARSMGLTLKSETADGWTAALARIHTVASLGCQEKDGQVDPFPCVS